MSKIVNPVAVDPGDGPQGSTAPARRRLLVFIPDRSGIMTALEPLCDFLRSQEELKDALLLPVAFSMSLYSNRRLSRVATDINAQIENYFLEHQASISGITLCGYSLGVLLARRAYLDARGYGPSEAPKSWASNVERLVFIAAICRGFNERRFFWWERAGMVALRLLGLGRSLREAYEGAPFVNNVRIDWAHHRQESESGPMVVNFLGTGDRLVRQEDAIDILQDPNARPLDVSGDHDSIVDPRGNEALYRLGVLGEPLPRVPVTLQRFPRAKRIYILLHGMRSSKRFMKALQTAITSAENSDADVRLPDFGYIPLALFLSGAQRRRLAARFVDDYTQCLSVNPGAEFRFAGHSNGTAILGLSLLENPRLVFRRVYLGGSVLPTNFDWSLVKGRGQVDFVRSDMGSEDWAVGILAKALERWSPWIPSFRGLGSAGYDGFSRTDVSPRWMNEVPVEGSHNEMFRNVDSIAAFLTAPDRRLESEDLIDSPRWFMALRKQGDLLIPLAAIAITLLAAACLLSVMWPVPYVSTFGGPIFGACIVAVALYVLFRY